MRKIFICSLIANFVFILYLILRPYHEDLRNHWTSLKSQVSGERYALLGDSLVGSCGWPTSKSLIYGIGGAKISELYTYVSFLHEKIDRVYLMAGINDLHADREPKQLLSDYKKWIEMIKTKLPSVEIYIHSLTPIHYVGLRGPPANKKIETTNSLFLQLAKTGGHHYVYLHSRFSAGPLTKYIAKDGLHYSKEGCKLWHDLLDMTLKLSGKQS